MWAIVDPDNKHEIRTFKIFVTGHEINNARSSLNFIGTAMDSYSIVYHLFEIK